MSGAPLNQCLQCGNCSAVCTLAPSDRPFPRKEMAWAAWGIKEKLIGNPDIWLCHQCGDCSSYCPRDVKPADVIAAIRQKTYMHYARPAFLGKLVNKPVWLPLAPAIPVSVIILIAVGYVWWKTRDLRRHLAVWQSRAAEDRQFLAAHERVEAVDGRDAGLDKLRRVIPCAGIYRLAVDVATGLGDQSRSVVRRFAQPGKDPSEHIGGQNRLEPPAEETNLARGEVGARRTAEELEENCLF